MNRKIILAELMLSNNTTWPEFMDNNFSPKDPLISIETITAELIKQKGLVASSRYQYQKQVEALERVIMAYLYDKRFDG